jgi:peptide/nickel transport system substrate-binding protein
MKKRVAISLIVIFGVFGAIVEALGNLTWYLSPRDPQAIEEAGRLQAVLGSLVKSPEGGLASTASAVSPASIGKQGGLNTSRSLDFKAVHRVAEWEGAANFSESPMLDDLVSSGALPRVESRLPKQPLVVIPPEQNGPYGGTWTRLGTGPKDINIVEARFAYDGLVRWGPKGKEILPNLARKWEVSEDGRVFTFWLREGMRWSDGHPYTADDIVFWRDEILLNKEITPVVIREFKRGGQPVEVEKVSDTVVKFKFLEPHGLFLKALATGRGYECSREPAHYLKRYLPKFVGQAYMDSLAADAGFDHWVPYFKTLREWRNVDLPRVWPWIIKEPPPAQPAVLERNPYYWKVDPEGRQLPYIDYMTFEVFDKETINFKAINGEMGMQGRHLLFENFPLFMENTEKGGYRVVQWLTGSGGPLLIAPNLNHKDPVLRELLEDRRFRIALSHAMNRDAINEIAYFGIGKPRQLAPPPNSEYYSESFERAYIDYNPELANKMLDEIGLVERNSDGIRFRPDGELLSVYIETTELNSRSLELIAADWTAVGVKTEVKEKARQLFWENQKAMNHDFATWGGADEFEPTLDPRWFVPWNDSSIQGQNYARWFRTGGRQGEKPKGDMLRVMELYNQIETSTDQQEHFRLIKEVLDLNERNLWVIGTVGETPSIFLVKDTFVNVPEVALSGWSFRTPGNTAVECYAIDPTRAGSSSGG